MNSLKQSKSIYEKSHNFNKQPIPNDKNNLVYDKLSGQVLLDNCYAINFTNRVQHHVYEQNRQRMIVRGRGSNEFDLDTSTTLEKNLDIYFGVK